MIVSLEEFKDIRVSEEEVTVGAGVIYSELVAELEKHKRALTNVLSTPIINVIGSLILCSHNSGYSKQVLS